MKNISSVICRFVNYIKGDIFIFSHSFILHSNIDALPQTLIDNCSSHFITRVGINAD
jgi:hypothetical protein